MATTAQLEANRENAKRSTGPVTDQGKAVSSQNACRHNLTGGPALAPGEDPEAYQQHLQSIHDLYEPCNAAAEFVVRQIADAMWRLNRCRRFEDELLTLSANPFLDDDDVMRRLDRLERYRQSIERTYNRFVREWRTLQMEDARRDGERAAAKDDALWGMMQALAAPPKPSRPAELPKPAAAPERTLRL